MRKIKKRKKEGKKKDERRMGRGSMNKSSNVRIVHNEAARRVAQSITRLQLISPRMTNTLASRSATRAGRKSRRRLDLSVLPNSGSQLPFTWLVKGTEEKTWRFILLSFSFFHVYFFLPIWILFLFCTTRRNRG